jgi:hypothetical protein
MAYNPIQFQQAEVRHFRAVFTPPADPGSTQIKVLEAARGIFV